MDSNPAVMLGPSLAQPSGSPGQPMIGSGDQEKKIRREIANSNERRRMQSINAGFQALRTLLPHHEGEKLSKAAILQQTAEYIYSLEQEKTRLLSQNCQLKRHLAQSQQNPDSPTETTNLEEEQPTAVKRSRVKPEKEPETIVVETATEPEDTCRIIVADNTTIGQETLLVPIASSSAPATTTEPEVTTVVKETIGQEARSFIVTTNPTGKNLDSIVEAIKHLEGDHLFAETGKGSSPQVVQERLSEGKKVVTEAGIIIYKN